jgi:rod shape-determining protein MreD
VIVAVVTLVLELSVRGAMTLHALGGISPSIAGSVVVFIALLAPRSTALWAAWLLGLLMDLCAPPPDFTPHAHLVGPYALGYPAACVLVLAVRTTVFRRRVLTIVFLTALSMVLVGLVAVALYTVHSWYPTEIQLRERFQPMGELGRRLGIALVSGLLAFPLGWLLLSTSRIWGFAQTGPGRR